MSNPGVKKLYKRIVKTAGEFKDRNFREYFTRIAKSDFESFLKPAGEVEAEKVAQLLKSQKENLGVLKRQTVIHNMYYTNHFDIKR